MSNENGHSVPRRVPMRRDPALPLMLIAGGIALIAVLGRVEARARSQQLWADAAFVFGEAVTEVALSLEALPAQVRRLDIDNYPTLNTLVADLRKTPQGKRIVAGLRLNQGEPVVFLEVSNEHLAPLLAAGRLPGPGEPEVLAGDLAQLEAFALDGVTFCVVGRLERGIGGLTRAYVLPAHDALRPHFFDEAGAEPGWLEPKGAMPRAEQGHAATPGPEQDDSGASDAPEAGGPARFPERVSGTARTTLGVLWGTVLGLLLVAAGGAVGQVRLLRRLSDRRCGVLQPILREIVARPRLLVCLHLLLYGLFFALMCAGVQYPVLNARVVGFVMGEFSEGSLKYIGAAYASENILRATLATFFHNYVIATVLSSILPSLFIPFAGVVKNGLSFAVVGFAMAPIWTGSNEMLVYHAITLTLELEAYVIAAFSACILPLRVFRGLSLGPLGREWGRGLAAIASGTVLAGVMLAVAALYEATTLVLLR